jgi:hypothetical protein
VSGELVREHDDLLAQAASGAGALEATQRVGDVGQCHMAGWALTIRTWILTAQDRAEDSRA